MIKIKKTWKDHQINKTTKNMTHKNLGNCYRRILRTVTVIPLLSIIYNTKNNKINRQIVAMTNLVI